MIKTKENSSSQFLFYVLISKRNFTDLTEGKCEAAENLVNIKLFWKGLDLIFTSAVEHGIT